MIFTDAGAATEFISSLHVPVQAVLDDVELAAYEPLCPLKSFCSIQQLGVGLVPLKAHEVDRFFPKPLRIGSGALDELAPIGDSVLFHEVGHAALEIVAFGLPD